MIGRNPAADNANRSLAKPYRRHIGGGFYIHAKQTREAATRALARLNAAHSPR